MLITTFDLSNRQGLLLSHQLCHLPLRQNVVLGTDILIPLRIPMKTIIHGELLRFDEPQSSVGTAIGRRTVIHETTGIGGIRTEPSLGKTNPCRKKIRMASRLLLLLASMGLIAGPSSDDC